MSSKNETIPLLVALVATGAILGGGFLLLKNQCTSGGSFFLCGIGSGRTSPSSPGSSPLSPPPSPRKVAAFPVPSAIPSGTTIRVDGSTSMVQMNSALQRAIERKFAGVSLLTNGRGSDIGIEKVLDGSIDIAAISRPLTEAEIAKGLVATPVVRDSIALVIGARNPFSGKLTATQVKDIFTGKITEWSEVGGSPTDIRVINRPASSGTYQTFRSEVLGGAEFGTGPNFVTMPRDATTPLLRELGLDGIGYATYSQVARQKTVRTVAIDGISPGDPTYPFQRTLYYVYKEPANEAVKAFLGFAISPEGQKAILEANRKLEE